MSAALFGAASTITPAFAAAPIECASQRARAEMAAVGAEMYAWLIDITSPRAPSASSVGEPLCPSSPPVDITFVPPIAAGDLRELLVPIYAGAVPKKDPWGHEYDYRLNLADLLSADAIAIRSAGADGRFESTTYDVRFTGGPEDDLVLYNDAWIRDLPRLDPVSRQELTAAQVRTVGAALLSWITDSASRPSPVRPPPSAEGPTTVDMANYTPITAEALADRLTTPPYIYTRCVSELDAWGTPYDYRLNDNLLLLRVAAIRSLGSDAVAQGEVYPVGAFPADERHEDIVWADGEMAREPDASGTALLLDGFESGELWGYWSCGPGF